MKLEKNTMYILLVSFLVILGILLSVTSRQEFSIISVDEVTFKQDGTPQWLINADGLESGLGEYVFTVNAKDVDPVKVKGGEIVPTKNLVIISTTEALECNYQLTKINSGFIDSIELLSNSKATLDFLDFEDTQVYQITTSSPEKSLFVNFKDKAGGQSQSLNIFSAGDTITMNDIDGEGQVTIQAREGGVSAKECPELSRTYIIDFIDQGLNIHAERKGDTFFGAVDKFIEISSDGLISDGFDCNFAKVSSDGTTKTEYQCDNKDKVKLVNYYNPKFTLLADADYFDFYYKPSTSGLPKILSVETSTAPVKEGTQSSVTIKVKNVATNDGAFKLYITSDYLALPLKSQQITLLAGEEGSLRFDYTTPLITNDGKFDADIKFCTVVSSGNSQCVTSNFDVDVANDDFCFGDCVPPTPVPVSCDVQHQTYDGQSCVCEEGWQEAEDYLGREYCEEAVFGNQTLVLILLASISAIVITAVIVTRKKNK